MSNKKQKISIRIIEFTHRCFGKKIIAFYLLLFFLFISCQKELKLKYDPSAIKQVIVSNFVANSFLKVNISKSKQPDDFSSVEFLNNCSVELFENGIFRETMQYVLRDTLSGLGFYTSSFKLSQNRLYKIISTHPSLGIASTEEYLPPYPNNLLVTLLQHADTLNPTTKGKYKLSFQDSLGTKNYYTITAFYKAIKLSIDSLGDSTYKTDFLFNVPSHSAEIPNSNNDSRSFTTDDNFDGQFKTFIFDFTSEYDNYFLELYNFYTEIYFIVEFSSVGPNYYNWYLQQLPKGETVFNNGQNERINISSNIINGYGHFSAFSSSYQTIQLK